MTILQPQIGLQLGKWGHNQLSEQILLILSIPYPTFPKGTFEHVVNHLCSQVVVWLVSGCCS